MKIIIKKQSVACALSPSGKHQLVLCIAGDTLKGIRSPCANTAPDARDALRRLTGKQTCHEAQERILAALRNGSYPATYLPYRATDDVFNAAVKRRQRRQEESKPRGLNTKKVKAAANLLGCYIARRTGQQVSVTWPYICIENEAIFLYTPPPATPRWENQSRWPLKDGVAPLSHPVLEAIPPYFYRVFARAGVEGIVT